MKLRLLVVEQLDGKPPVIRAPGVPAFVLGLSGVSVLFAIQGDGVEAVLAVLLALVADEVFGGCSTGVPAW